MNLKYKVTFLDYWHLGSGLSGGAKSDSLVIKDSDKLPYLSGKTIKGLAKEMAELFCDKNFIDKTFGIEGSEMGKLYFSNAILDEQDRKEIITNKLEDNLYTTLASTQIGNNGIAVDDSLREIEVGIPITLEGKILDIDSQEDKEKLLKALKMIKRMGLNRNRGLGRCEIEEIK